MSLAQRIVRRVDDEAPANADGTRSFRMFCDDRLVAALYTATHYDGDSKHEPLTVRAAAAGNLVLVAKAAG